MLYIARSQVKISHNGEYGEVDSYYLNKATSEDQESLVEKLEAEMSEMGPRGLAEYLKYGSDERVKLDEVIESIIVGVTSEGASTIIKSKRELTEIELKVLEEYLSGQYSDGWGEGFEQRELYSYEEESQEEAWDEEEQEVYMEDVVEKFEVCAHFWQPDTNFKVTIIKGE